MGGAGRGGGRGSGGREPKQSLQTEWDKDLSCQACTAQTKSSVTNQTLFIVGSRAPKLDLFNPKIAIIGPPINVNLKHGWPLQNQLSHLWKWIMHHNLPFYAWNVSLKQSRICVMAFRAKAGSLRLKAILPLSLPSLISKRHNQEASVFWAPNDPSQRRTLSHKLQKCGTRAMFSSGFSGPTLIWVLC